MTPDWAEVRNACLVYEDEAILALNKPPGVSVMGERHEPTDLVRVAEAAGERLFPVHRIDKVTSGLILLAKELRHHSGLTRQFNKQTVDKAYLAITRGGPGGLPERGTIELPLSVGRKNRVRVAGRREDITRRGDTWTLPPSPAAGDHPRKSYPSLTHFARVWQDATHSLLAVRPVTGRRHQIRVHLAWIGHAIEGDPLFEKQPQGDCHLHSWRLAFDADWAGNARMRLVAPPPPGFWRPVGGPVRGDEPGALLERAEEALGRLAI
ncbi:RluA family pseudouridine synthase [Streptomyces sp. 6N223]|uniref:RluA family pseudouridine synthase n=1 Tax=Streptomyces sp. 6N223 TaxID=3457412 RepID=UPI003FD07B1B